MWPFLLCKKWREKNAFFRIIEKKIKTFRLFIEKDSLMLISIWSCIFIRIRVKEIVWVFQ